MDPSQLIPATDPISVPWIWFEALGILTFVVHLLFMNAMFGGSIIALVVREKGRSRMHPVAQSLASKLPTLVALTVNMGVAPLLFIQVIYGNFLYTSTILMAVYWLSIVVLVILAYYLLYYHAFKYDVLANNRKLVMAMVVALFMVVAFFFSNAMTLMIVPPAWEGYFSNVSGTLLNLTDPTLIPRYLHFVVAAMAVGGLFVALLGYMQRRQNKDGEPQITIGLQWFTSMTLVQFVIGTWFLLSLKREVMLAFLGDNGFATAVFLVALAVSLLALYAGFTRRILLAAGSTVALVSLMAIVRALLRWEYLAPYFHPSDLTLQPQYSPLVMFILFLVVGLGVVAYMLHLYLSAGKED
ncbi:hypothetical protein [Desulfoplanes formicivorans]|uniref:Uncharacterized protein n=1 Tax=Desulfoplanes formicivorans TaxID=1592317 RepID=A0A194AFA9_9BACT|nr:hypothetical protein [Desulfoplanes formicivorans]GAU07776.1 hypothetical protein DPF_0475 [Desulfoplanes formicivorans]